VATGWEKWCFKFYHFGMKLTFQTAAPCWSLRWFVVQGQHTLPTNSDMCRFPGSHHRWTPFKFHIHQCRFFYRTPILHPLKILSEGLRNWPALFRPYSPENYSVLRLSTVYNVLGWLGEIYFGPSQTLAAPWQFNEKNSPFIYHYFSLPIPSHWRP
jgi:hypothetical protein